MGLAACWGQKETSREGLFGQQGEKEPENGWGEVSLGALRAWVRRCGLDPSPEVVPCLAGLGVPGAGARFPGKLKL